MTIIRKGILGGITLTGEAAAAFRKQFIYNPIKDNERAKTALKRGLVMLEEFKKKGYITVKPKISPKLK